MGAALAAKRIESISAHTQPDVSWIVPKLWALDVHAFHWLSSEGYLGIMSS
jgi:hypothetical protein